MKPEIERFFLCMKKASSSLGRRIRDAKEEEEEL